VNTRDTVRKLLAFDAGKPLPKGTTLHLPKRAANDTLILAFVRMGGESRPWGVAIGPPHRASIYTAAEARDRELVGGMLENIAPTLLAHMGHPAYVRDPQLPYVWLPNASHVEMLHFLAFTYTFAKRGDPRRMQVLNALGRAANWLFQESIRPGQLSCIDASAALRECFVFPAEEIRQAHTGYLLSWLETRGDFRRRLEAAAQAEKHAISTSLDPQIERNRGLDEYVEQFNEAKREGNNAVMVKASEAIRAALVPELQHRFDVAARAYIAFIDDKRPVNSGLRDLAKTAGERHAEFITIETKVSAGTKAWIASPETDANSLVAASRYLTLEADHEVFINAVVHEDSDLQNDLLATGDGVRGRITAIRDESEGRKTRAIWIIDEDERRPLRVRSGDKLVQAAYSSRKARVRDITEDAKGHRRLELEIVAGIREGGGALGRKPLDRWWRGQTVTFLALGEPGFAFMKRKMLWDRTGPGIWLTHRQPREETPTSAAEDDNDIDAVTP
jgi:hypothetical protein